MLLAPSVSELHNLLARCEVELDLIIIIIIIMNIYFSHQVQQTV